MKTNSVLELLKAKGVKVDSPPQAGIKTNESSQVLKSKRTRLYHFDESSETSTPIEPSTNSKEVAELAVASSKELLSRSNELDSISTAESPATRQQLDSRKETIRQQQDSISTAKRLRKNELDSISTAESPATRQQLDSRKRSFFEVVGKERELLLFIFKQMVFNGGNSTRPISTDELKSAFSLSAKRLANLVERLIAKKTLLIEKGQRGRASWRVFSLPQNIYQEIRSEVGSEKPIRQQLDSIYTSKSPAESPADPSRSSSIVFNNLNKNTTTTDELDSWLSVPEILGKVPIRQLREASREGGMNHEELQQSLDHFGLDLMNGKVNSRTPNKIAILVGALKKGGYFSQECQSQLDQALEQVQKRRETIKQREADMETAQLKLEFDDWIKTNPGEFEKLKNSVSYLGNLHSPKMIEMVVFPKWIQEVKLKDPKTLNL